jgi:beta-lactam-binding protein with PASTA domain
VAGADTSSHSTRQTAAPPEFVLQMVAALALTTLGEVLGSSLTGKFLAGALGALLGAFLTARGSHHTRRIVAVALLLALLDALRGAANALASTTRRGTGRDSTHGAVGDDASSGLGAQGTGRPPGPAAWMPGRPMLALAAAASSFAVGTGAVAVAGGFDESAHVTQGDIPNVIGQNASRATAILASNGFTAAIHRRPDRLHGLDGRVLAQSPSPGESRPLRSAVVLTVAGGLRPTLSAPVPSVVGLPVQQAIGRLKGLFRTELVRVAGTTTAGRVMVQAPRAGSMALIGSVVSLTVSSSARVPQVTTVPVLAGVAVEGAVARLKAIGLSANPMRESSETVASGIVIDSIPEAGASVAEGSTITLKVSAGPRGGQPVPVPPLAGLAVEGALARLKVIGLSAGLVREPSETVDPGVVIGSAPAAGASVEPGSTVTLTVSTGPA